MNITLRSLFSFPYRLRLSPHQPHVNNAESVILWHVETKFVTRDFVAHPIAPTTAATTYFEAATCIVKDESVVYLLLH